MIEATLSEAFNDIKALMDNARTLVALAKRLKDSHAPSYLSLHVSSLHVIKETMPFIPHGWDYIVYYFIAAKKRRRMTSSSMSVLSHRLPKKVPGRSFTLNSPNKYPPRQSFLAALIHIRIHPLGWRFLKWSFVSFYEQL